MSTESHQDHSLISWWYRSRCIWSRDYIGSHSSDKRNQAELCHGSTALLHHLLCNAPRYLQICNSGAMIRLRSNGGLFNLQRLKARNKLSLLLLGELLFADDCALIAHNGDELQSILNDFARVASSYGLTISIKKTEVMPQPKLGNSPQDPVIMKKFCYLDAFLSQNACIDDEITSWISKGSASFGQLHHRLLSDHGISLSKKIGVYKTAVLTMLFLDLVPPSCEKNLTSSI